MLWKWAEDYTDMSVAAAEQMRQAVDRNPCAVVVLPTGHSPQLAYRIFRDGILRFSTKDFRAARRCLPPGERFCRR